MTSTAATIDRPLPTPADLTDLASGAPFLSVTGLLSGYGRREVLHGIDLHVAAGQSLCLIGPNGAGKSTVLHSIFGLTDVFAGSIRVDDVELGPLSSSDRLRSAGVGYVMQDSSVFPDMTVEENLWLGGYLMKSADHARTLAEEIFDTYPRLAQRRRELARSLSGGERRLLEISRSLMMEPRVLLVDEPSIGLEPRYIDLIFDILKNLQEEHGKTIVIVEQNARKGLEFADIGYVLVSGRLAMAGPGAELLEDPDVGRLFLGARPESGPRSNTNGEASHV